MKGKVAHIIIIIRHEFAGDPVVMAGSFYLSAKF